MSDDVTGEGSPSDPMKAVADALERAVQATTDSVVDAKAAVDKSLPGAARSFRGSCTRPVIRSRTASSFRRSGLPGQCRLITRS